MVNISDRVTEILVKEDYYVADSKSLMQCIEFTKKMKTAGILHPDEQFTPDILEGGLNQLKLYALTSIDLK